MSPVPHGPTPGRRGLPIPSQVLCFPFHAATSLEVCGASWLVPGCPRGWEVQSEASRLPRGPADHTSSQQISFLGGLALNEGVNWLIKHVIQEPRPCGGRAQASGARQVRASLGGPRPPPRPVLSPQAPTRQ